MSQILVERNLSKEYISLNLKLNSLISIDVILDRSNIYCNFLSESSQNPLPVSNHFQCYRFNMEYIIVCANTFMIFITKFIFIYLIIIL